MGSLTSNSILIVLGMFLFATSLETEESIGEWIASSGWTFNMLGLILIYQYETGNWEDLIYM